VGGCVWCVCGGGGGGGRGGGCGLSVCVCVVCEGISYNDRNTARPGLCCGHNDAHDEHNRDDSRHPAR